MVPCYVLQPTFWPHCEDNASDLAMEEKFVKSSTKLMSNGIECEECESGCFQKSQKNILYKT